MIGFIAGALTWIGPVGIEQTLAQPNESQRVEKLSVEGLKYYNLGKYPQAIASYLEAYQVRPVAALLYNIAKIYDNKLQERELAIQFYRKYMAATDSDPKLVGQAVKRIQELQAQEEATAAAPASAPPATEPGTPPPAAPAVATSEPSADRGATNTDDSAIATTGYVLGGVGLAGITFGSIAGLVAKRQDSDADGHCNANNYCDQTGLDKTDSAKTWSGVATATWIVGGALLTTGVLMVVLAPSGEEPAEAGVALTPTVGPNSGGLVFQGVW